MNIMFINTKSKHGGVVSWYITVMNGLIKRGHCVFLVTTKTINAFNSVVGLKLYQFPSAADFDPVVIYRLIVIIKKHKINHIIANTKKEVSLGALAALLTKSKLIRTIGNYTDLNDSTINRVLMNYFIHNTITPCKAIITQAKKAYPALKLKNYNVIYNGVPIQEYSLEELQNVRTSWNLQTDAFIFGMNVQLVNTKGIFDVLKALSLLQSEHSNAHLVIAGEGYLKEEIINSAKGLEIEDKVHLAGFVSNPQQYAAAYDVCVLASYDEGFPIAMVEYMAAGKAIIVTTAGGITEIVQSGYNGLLFTPGDVEALYQDMLILIKNKELRDSLGRTAIQTVKESFTEQLMLDKVEELLYELS